MDGESPLRIVICPWLAFGHLLPYLELADRLASRGHRVLYVSPPRNLARLPPAPRVELVALPLPRVEGLPAGAESTNDVPEEKWELLWAAFDGLAAPFAALLAAACADETAGPHWVLADTFHHWAAAAAREHKLPCAILLPTAAMFAAAHEPEALSQPRYEREDTAPLFKADGTSGMSVVQRYHLTLERCMLGAIRSSFEWEPETLPLVSSILGKPVVPLGLLPPSPDGAHAAAGADDAAVR